MRIPGTAVAVVASLLVSPLAFGQERTEGTAPTEPSPIAVVAVAPDAEPAAPVEPTAPAEPVLAAGARLDVTTADDAPLVLLPEASALALEQAPAARPKAFEYSDGYYKRAKIHKLASWATLPLFALTYAAGEKLYDLEGGDSAKTWHTVGATSVGVLFGINSVTGIWNLKEGWRDPNGRTKRLVHSMLMLGADAGFAATGFLAPGDEDGQNERSTHRTVALTSMGIATAGYLFMLFSR